MLKIQRKINLCLLLLLIGSTASLEAANQIECRLQAPPDHPLPDNLQVILRMLSGGQVEAAIPQANGRINFSGLRAGKYVVSVRADGFLPVEQEVEIPSGYIHNIVNVVIRLTPEPEEEGVPRGERMIPVQSLSVPRKAQEEVELAEKAGAKGSLKKAIRHAEKALELYPDYFEAYNNLAVYHYQSGRKEKSIELFQKALALNPDAVGANSNVGRVYLELGQPKSALPFLQHACEINPDSTEIQYHLARAFILSLQFSDALKPLKLALELEPPVNHARFLLAHVLYEIGDLPGAVRELQLYLKTKPANGRELEQRLREWNAVLGTTGR